MAEGDAQSVTQPSYVLHATWLDVVDRTTLTPAATSPPWEIPAGWQRATEVASAHGLNRSTIQKWLRPYQVSHPEWFRSIIANPPRRGATSVKVIAQPLVHIIEQRIRTIRSYGPPPNTWVNAYDYARQHHLNTSLAQALFRQVTRSHSLWQGRFVSRQPDLGLRLCMYYAPEAVLAVTKLHHDANYRITLHGKQAPPAEWQAIGVIAKTCGRSHSVIADWARQATVHQPQALQQFYSVSARHNVLYASPELAAHLRQRAEETPLIRKARALQTA